MIFFYFIYLIWFILFNEVQQYLSSEMEALISRDGHWLTKVLSRKLWDGIQTWQKGCYCIINQMEEGGMEAQAPHTALPALSPRGRFFKVQLYLYVQLNVQR